MAIFLTQTEEQVLNDLDRLIDGYNLVGKEIDYITLSKKQHNAIKKIVDKIKKDDTYRKNGSLNLTKETYRDIEFNVIGQKRRPRRKKDIHDIFNG